MKIRQPYFRQFDGWWYVQIRNRGKRKQFRLCQGRENKHSGVLPADGLDAEGGAGLVSLLVVAGLDTFLATASGAHPTAPRCSFV